jgi:hypothetical protein
MTVQLPTRITIEVHPAEHDPRGRSATGDGRPIVRVVPEPAPGPALAVAYPIVAAEPREEMPMPAAYDPGPCTCLDDEDCGADHANE